MKVNHAHDMIVVKGGKDEGYSGGGGSAALFHKDNYCLLHGNVQKAIAQVITYAMVLEFRA